MKRYFLGLVLVVSYCLSIYVFYTILPPTYSVAVTLAPASYLHIQEDVTTNSRVARMVYLPSYEVAKIDLTTFYKKCKKSPLSSVRVLPGDQLSPLAYKFVISDVSQDISMDHIKCAIDLIGKEQDALRQLMVSVRKVNPPAGIENDKVSLIATEDLAGSGRLRALARSAALSLILGTFIYGFRKFFLRAQQSGLLGKGTSMKKID